MEALEYSLESPDLLYRSGEALTSPTASPGGMEASAIVALLSGSLYFGYKRAKNNREELEEKYLSD